VNCKVEIKWNVARTHPTPLEVLDARARGAVGSNTCRDTRALGAAGISPAEACLKVRNPMTKFPVVARSAAKSFARCVPPVNRLIKHRDVLLREVEESQRTIDDLVNQQRALKRELEPLRQRSLMDFIDFDADTTDMIARVEAFTVTGPARIAALKSAVEYVIRNDIAGDIVECGVWKGGSMMVAALTLLKLGAQRRLYLFDTFAGMTAPTDVDRDIFGKSMVESFIKGQCFEDGEDFNVPLEEVRTNLRGTGYDENLITYVKGPVEETLPSNSPETIAILRLDTDWYESTRHELQHLFPRVSAGGVLIIDDYGHHEGARRAVDEFLAATKAPLLLNRIDYTGRIGVKPRAPA
jgi:O-methyltransferase